MACVGRFAVRGIRSAAFCLLLAMSSGRASSADVDFTPYADAAEYCRGSVPKPLALSPDNRLLCFDGPIQADLDVSAATNLADRGIAVVRSDGGDRVAAARLANALRDRHATVVVRDRCLLTCASFIVIATSETYVLRDALVAWGLPQWGARACAEFREVNDGAGLLFTSGSCEESASGDANSKRLWHEFYRERMAGPTFSDPPESRFVRRALLNLYRSTGLAPERLWTWNPRYYARAIKAKVVYQHYPDSQDELDDMVSRSGLTIRVIYDP